MKLRLPLLLLSALVAAQLGATATADTLTPQATTVIGSGVFYDTGKNHYSSDSSIPKGDVGYIDDSLFCWATAGANMVQYWQDTYYKYHDADTTPANGVTGGYSKPYGTSYLAVYQEALKKQSADKTGYHTEFIDWWFKGTEVTNGVTVLESIDGNYNTLAGGKTVSQHWLPRSKDVLGTSLDTIFSTQGQLAGLSFTSYDTVTERAARVHAVTCMGYEKDEDGVVTALILADADDEYFGAVRVNVTYGGPDDYADYSKAQGIENFKLPLNNIPLLSSDDVSYDYGKYLVYVEDLAQIVTPSSYTNESGDTVTVAQAAVNANTDVSVDNYTLNTSTSLEADTTVVGKHVTVGNGTNIVVLTSDHAETLFLQGNGLHDSGLEVKAGSLVSLKRVEVTGYQGGGIEAVGHTSFHDGSLSLGNNTTQGNGAGASNASYMEIKDNGEGVLVYGNAAQGTDSVGGGIYNGDGAVLSLRGNTSVFFANNTATKGGNDIYNGVGSTAIVADNATVTFASAGNGKAAVTNDGTLYLANKDAQKITFVDSALDGKGTTYIGKDNRSSGYDGKVTFTDGYGATKEMTVAANRTKDASAVAALKNVTVSVGEINGAAAAQSSIAAAQIISSDDLDVSRVTLDNSSTLSATNTLHLDNVVIKLANVTYSQLGDILIYDLSGTLTASQITMNNLVFDTDGLELGAEDKVTVYLGTAPLNGTARLLTADGLRDHVELENGAVYFSGDSGLVPEPATATLSLLALAALAARRKRRHA